MKTIYCGISWLFLASGSAFAADTTRNPDLGYLMLAPNSAIQAEYKGTCWSVYNTASDTVVYLPLGTWADYDKPRDWPIRVDPCTAPFPQKP